MEERLSLLSDLLKIDAFKIGEFHLQTGNVSPFYVDLRSIPSYPKIFNAVVKAIRGEIENLDIKLDNVCGVPYSGIPFAASLASQHEIPMLIVRKEAKKYGTKKLVEGVIEKGVTGLIIEDVVVSGASIIETAAALRKEGLIVTDCVALLDRLQGGQRNLKDRGIALHSLYDVKDILTLYCSRNIVEESKVENIMHYLSKNVFDLTEKC